MDICKQIDQPHGRAVGVSACDVDRTMQQMTWDGRTLALLGPSVLIAAGQSETCFPVKG